MSETVKLGKVSMTLGGDYNSSQAYDKLTCVYYDGSSWVSRKAVPAGVAPTAVNSAYWQKVSDRGAQGPQGQSYVDKTLVPIVNDLTTGGSSNVLAAEQGKVLDTKLSELSEEVADKIGGESVVYEEEKVQTIRYMKFTTPLYKGLTLELTLLQNAATMVNGVNIFRVVSATEQYQIGLFTHVGQTLTLVLDGDAPGGLQFGNLDANTTYGVKVIAKEVQIGTITQTIDSIAEIVTSPNLFNKGELVAGYINERDGSIVANSTSYCSSPIPVIGGHYYQIAGRDDIGTTGIRCIDADGNILKVIATQGSENDFFILPNDDASAAVYNGAFQVPTDAIQVQFTVIFVGSGAVDDIMLIDIGEEYQHITSIQYKPYGDLVLIKPSALPTADNPLLGKSVIFTGDSICNASTDYYNGGGWAKRIGEKNGMTWVNRGISGGTLTNKNVVGSTFTISETDFGSGADYIILEGGTNDADRIGSILNGEKPTAFGTWDIGDYTSNFTNDTLCGALEMMLKKIVTDFPTSKVGFIIAMKMGETSKGYTADKYNRRAYFETIIQICRKWGVPVLNLWDECTMNPKIPSHYTSGQSYLYVDGQHLTGKGYDFITPIIEAWMKTL